MHLSVSSDALIVCEEGWSQLPGPLLTGGLDVFGQDAGGHLRQVLLLQASEPKPGFDLLNATQRLSAGRSLRGGFVG